MLATFYRRLIEVANLVLVLLHIVMRVEPSIALNLVVVCCEERFEAAKEDMVFIKLMIADEMLSLVPVAALRTQVQRAHLRNYLVASIVEGSRRLTYHIFHFLIRLLLLHIVVVLIYLLVHHLNSRDRLRKRLEE